MTKRRQDNSCAGLLYRYIGRYLCQFEVMTDVSCLLERSATCFMTLALPSPRLGVCFLIRTCQLPVSKDTSSAAWGRLNHNRIGRSSGARTRPFSVRVNHFVSAAEQPQPSTIRWLICPYYRNRDSSPFSWKP